MPSRAQNGGSISDNFAQQSAHKPAPPPSGARQDGQSGGSTISSPARSAARTPSRNCVTREGAAFWLAETNSFMLQLYQMPSNPTIFDRTLLRARQRRAWALGPETFLIDRVAVELAERLSAVVRNFERAVDLGTPTDAVRHALEGGGKVAALIAAAPYAAPQRVAADEEALPFADGSLDLVVSALALQFVNDLPGTLVQIRRALKPDGLLLAALIGGDSLTELRQAFAAAEAEIEDGISPRVAPLADVRDLGALLQRAGFALPVADVDRLTVRYASPTALLHDLRRMGAGNALTERSRRPLRRATLARLLEIYGERFADPDGRVRATFDIIWLSGWAPHESQQKPLAPGSARRRLADALGTKETRLPRDGDR